MSERHSEHRAKRDGIYGNIQKAGSNVGVTEGLVPGVAGPQGAYLVAWRHPEHVGGVIEEVSLTVASLAQALTYDRRKLHTTLTDHGLAPNFVVDPADRSHVEVLTGLTDAVRAGLDTAGARTWRNSDIYLPGPATNGKSVIIPGRGNDEFLDVNAAIKVASVEHGFNGGSGIKGAWGDHVTVNQFTAGASIETARDVADYLSQIPEIGVSEPVAIDVGYLAVSAEDGFTFTTHERFPLVRE